MSDNDDEPIGRVLTRREVLTLFGVTGAAFLAGCAVQSTAAPSPIASTATTVSTVAPSATTAASTATTAATATTATTAATATTGATATTAATATTEATATTAATAAEALSALTCVVRPELTEGPYFVDERLDRSDIRADTGSGTISAGVPLQIEFRVAQVSNTACVPLSGVTVDVWHCDALGVYSDVQGNSGDFLRGYQVTDDTGKATFTTIYPGWYRGRAVHIHFKLRTDPDSNQGYEFTSQFFFDDSLSDQIYTLAPYSQKGQRDQRNSSDGIYNGGGSQLLLTLTEDGAGGYKSTFDIALDVA